MSGDAGAGPPNVPRWVKVFAIIGILVVLAAIFVLAFGGTQHGPGRHASPSGTSGTTSPHEGSSHTPPPTHHTTPPEQGRQEAYDGKPDRP